MTPARPSLVPLTVQLVPKRGAGIAPAEWEARARRVVALATEDGMPPDELRGVLAELSLADDARRSWCFDGFHWWGWDGATWVQDMPGGTLYLLPFTMDTHVERTPAFAPTHRAPEGGIAVWAEPDLTLDPETLDGGTDLMLVEEREDSWARVRCENGTEGWVDGRLLRTSA